jgi:hypothetical protein
MKALIKEIYEKMQNVIWEAEENHPNDHFSGKDRVETEPTGITFDIDWIKGGKFWDEYRAVNIEVTNCDGKPLPNINNYLNNLQISYVNEPSI